MTNKTIESGNSSTIQSGEDIRFANIASEAIKACSLKAEESRRQSISIIDGLRALNAELCQLDQALKMAYGGT
jgi:hypothetical protein